MFVWLAIFCALGLHAIILILPITRSVPVSEIQRAPIELQLPTFSPPAPVPLAALPEPASLPPSPATGIPAEPPEVEPAKPREAVPTTHEPPPTASLVARKWQHGLDSMSEPEKRLLTSTILARQFITEESATDQLFGKPLQQPGTELYKEFHYPLRPDLLTMLDKPIPDVPFDYTPGLVYFAYDPGVKGDLQRFWDVITPEFGWRTKYGTEVRCVLVLVLVGCGWK